MFEIGCQATQVENCRGSDIMCSCCEQERCELKRCAEGQQIGTASLQPPAVQLLQRQQRIAGQELMPPHHDEKVKNDLVQYCMKLCLAPSAAIPG